MADTIHVGTLLVLRAVFTAPPSEVALQVVEADGAVSAYEAGQDAEARALGDGVTFELDWLTRQHGTHWFVAVGRGAVWTSKHRPFYVERLRAPVWPE